MRHVHHLLLVVSLALLPVVTFGQKKPMPPKPTLEVQALLDKGAKARDKYQWKEALQIFEQALAEARMLHDKDGEANTLNNIGGVYASAGQPQKALPYYEQGLSLFEEVRARIGSLSESKISCLTQNLGNYDAYLNLFSLFGSGRIYVVAQDEGEPKSRCHDLLIID